MSDGACATSPASYYLRLLLYGTSGPAQPAHRSHRRPSLAIPRAVEREVPAGSSPQSGPCSLDFSRRLPDNVTSQPGGVNRDRVRSILQPRGVQPWHIVATQLPAKSQLGFDMYGAPQFLRAAATVFAPDSLWRHRPRFRLVTVHGADTGTHFTV